MPLQQRIDAERQFFAHKPSVMVATEAVGEGINLQFCSLMVNYDMPWNPNRLEQRMGRIHRYGQQQEARIYNLVADNTREGEVMARLLHKLDDMRKALGSDRVYDVIGEIIPAPRFDALMKDWLALYRYEQAHGRRAAEQGKPAEAGIHRAVLPRSVSFFRRHHHGRKAEGGRRKEEERQSLVNQSDSARLAQTS
jgi:superfamily II DNA/RNA helicase